jgi:hypothetical protein
MLGSSEHDYHEIFTNIDNVEEVLTYNNSGVSDDKMDIDSEYQTCAVCQGADDIQICITCKTSYHIVSLK